jgi:sugar-specific transcriptional regulator TrmB
VKEERCEELQDYGLTEYESRAYLALLELEVAEASQVAEVARVPRTKIYTALEGLEEKRLVRVIPERPKRFAVEPIENYIEDLESRHREKAEELSQAREDLADEFAPEGRLDPAEAGTFEAFDGRSSASNRFMEALDEVEEELTVVTSGSGLHRIAYHADRLEDVEDAAIRVLCPVGDADPDDVEAVGEVAEVRNAPIDTGPATVAIVDREEALVIHHVPDDEHVFQGSDPGLWTDDGGLVRALTALVAGSWTLAVEDPPHEAPAPARVNGHMDLATELERVTEAATA